MKNKALFIAFFCVLYGYNSISQIFNEPYIDSIIREADLMKMDSGRVLYLIESAQKVKRKNNYQALRLLEEAEIISKRINFLRGIAISKLNFSEIYRVKGDNEIAIKNCTSAIALMDSINDSEFLPDAYNELAQIYYDIGNKEESFKKYKIAYAYSKKKMNMKQMGRSLTNMGVYYAEKGAFDKALTYFKECEIIALNTESQYGYSLSLINLGACYSQLTNYDLALNDFNKAIEICKDYDLKNNLSYAYLKMSEMYVLKGEDIKVEEYLIKAESTIIREMDLALKRDIYESFYMYYESQRKHKISLKYFKRYNSINEEIKQNKINKTISELKAKNDNIKREKEIALLKKRNEMETTWNLGLFIGFSFLLFSSIMIYLELRQRKIKKEQELSYLHQLSIEDELEMLQTKINPHFLYNALNSIASLAEDEPAQAEKMVLSLADLFRYSINAEDGHYTEIRKAIELVKKYLEIEKVRYGERLEYKFILQPGTEDLLIPRFLLQPLVENAIKHGVSKIRQGNIILKISKRGSRLNIFLYDNGPPFPKNFVEGYGSTNVKKKLQILYKAKHKIQYLNKPEKMVKITIIDPLLVSPVKLNV